MPTAKNGFQILDLHLKNMYFKNKSTRFFNAYLLDKFRRMLALHNYIEL